MVISSTSELEEPAEWTLRASAMSPLLRYGLHLSWSQDLECELPLVLSSVLGAWRLEEGLGHLGEASPGTHPLPAPPRSAPGTPFAQAM